MIRVLIEEGKNRFNLTGLGRSDDLAGHNFVEKWDYYYPNGYPSCISVLNGSLAVGKTVECIPGGFAITSKRYSAWTMKRAYGRQDASRIIPRSFSLPYEQESFERHLRDTNYAGLWALKRDVHRGSGIDMVFGTKAGVQARMGTPTEGKAYVTAQQVILDQYLPIGRHASNLRLYVDVAGGGNSTGVFRAYLFKGGYLRFGSELPPSRPETEGEAQKFVVNFVQDGGLPTWTIADLQEHLRTTTGSDTAFEKLWNNTKRAVASALASAAPAMRAITTDLDNYNGGNYGVLGVDAIISSDLEPWIIEINAGPSFIQSYSNCSYINPNLPPCPSNSFDEEKLRFLRAHLRNIRSIWDGVEERATQAARSVRSAKSSSCIIDEDLLRAVMDSSEERAEAISNGFEDLTPMLYSALDCMDGNLEGCRASLPLRPPFGMTKGGKDGGSDGNDVGSVEGADDDNKEEGYFRHLLVDRIVSEWMKTEWNEPMSADETLHKLCEIASAQRWKFNRDSTVPSTQRMEDEL